MAKPVILRFIADRQRLQSDMLVINKSLGGFKGLMSDINRIAGGFTVATIIHGVAQSVKQFVRDSIDEFRQLEQAVGGTQAVFLDASGTIDRFAANSVKSVGLSEREFRDATTQMGGHLKRVTGDVDFAATQSVALTDVAADLAATFGGTTAEAVDRLAAAFRGEADPAERLNLNLKATEVQAHATELGMGKVTTGSENYTLALIDLIFEQAEANGAIGQFEREEHTLEGQLQRTTAEIANQKGELGQNLAPAYLRVIELTNQFTQALDSNLTQIKKSEEGTLGFTESLWTEVGVFAFMNQELKKTDEQHEGLLEKYDLLWTWSRRLNTEVDATNIGFQGLFDGALNLSDAESQLSQAIKEAGEAAEDSVFSFSKLDKSLQNTLKRVEENFDRRKATEEKLAALNDRMVEAEQQRDERIADARDAHHDRITDATQSHQDRLADAHDSHLDRVQDAQESHNDRVEKAQRDHHKERTDAERTFNEKVKDATNDRNKDLRELEKDAAQERAEVIADRTRDLFDTLKLDIDVEEGVKFRDIFKGVRQQTRDLEGFFRNLGRARRKGLSETAISALGIDEFTEESSAVLAAITRASSTEIGRLNKQINRQQKAAARQAQKEAKNMLGPVAEALREITREMADKTAEINVKHRERLKEARSNFNKAVADADRKLNESITDSTKTLNKAVADSTATLNETVADSVQTLNRTVADSSKTLKEGLSDAQAAFTETVNTLDKQREEVRNAGKKELEDRKELGKAIMRVLIRNGELQVDESGNISDEVVDEIAAKLGVAPKVVREIFKDVRKEQFSKLSDMVDNSGTQSGKVVARMLKKLRIGVSGIQAITEDYAKQLKEGLDPVILSVGGTAIVVPGKAGKKGSRAGAAAIRQALAGRHLGGPIPGMGSGDIVPIMAEPGEHMLTKREVQAAGGHEKVFELRKGLVAGARQGLRIGGIVQAGRAIQRMGYSVGEHPAFGGVAPVHVPNSYHYRAQAVDVNWPGANESARLDQLQSWILGNIERSAIRQLIWRYKNHWGHLHLAMGPGRGLYMPGAGPGAGFMAMPDLPPVPDTPRGGFGRTAKWAMRHTREAAQKWLMESAFSTLLDPQFTAGARGNVQKMARDALNRRGWGQYWPQLNSLVSRESSWRPNAQNPRSTAFGLFQFLNSTWSTVGMRKTSDPATQIEAGLRYISQRYGNPANAWAFWQRNNWYHGGGPIPSYMHGTAYVPRDGPAMLHRGEQVVPANAAPPQITIKFDFTGSDRQMMELMRRAISIRGGGVQVLGVT